MYNDREELAVAIFRVMESVDDLSELGSNPEYQYLNALSQVYESALKDSHKYGWIGVGSITFAENALRSYQSQYEQLEPVKAE